MTRLLNHVELVYRPGERELAKRFFELLGCRVMDTGGTFVSAMVDPGVKDFVNNCFYASEVTEEQWRLDSELLRAVGDGDEIGNAAGEYLARLRATQAAK